MKELLQVLKALSDEIRLRMLKLLEQGELCVCELMEVLKMPQSTVSKHLGILYEAGLVERKKMGTWSYYRLAETGINKYSLLFKDLLKDLLKDDEVIQEDLKNLRRLRERKSPQGEQLLILRWKRLVDERGLTCPRCADTERELERACKILEEVLRPLGYKVKLFKEAMSLEDFQKDPLRSNLLLINERPLEEWLEAKTGSSPCCEVCGERECRTLVINSQSFEVITADLIIKGALKAIADLMTVTLPAIKEQKGFKESLCP